jgi:hypothetical protein
MIAETSWEGSEGLDGREHSACMDTRSKRLVLRGTSLPTVRNWDVKNPRYVVLGRCGLGSLNDLINRLNGFQGII